MSHLLDKYDKEKNFFSFPFPHIIIENCLDKELYNLLADNFPNDDSFSPKIKGENKPYWITGSNLVNETNNVWADFIKRHISQQSFDKFVDIIYPYMSDLDPNMQENLGKDLRNCSFKLAEAGGEKNPRNRESDIVISISAGINTPTKTKSTIDPPHADIPQKLFNSLLYMKTDDDDSSGGDLILYQTQNKFFFTSESENLYEVDKKYLNAIKTVKYSKNVFLLFPHKVNAIHGVTAREPTIYTRRYINLNMESYILKNSTFYKALRSLFGRIKFALRKIPFVRKLRDMTILLWSFVRSKK